MCLFVESIRLHDGKLFYLDYHQRRLNRTVEHFFPGKHKIKLTQIKIPPENKRGTYKVRVLYSDRIEKIEYIPYRIRTINSLRIVVDDTIDYSFKYTERKCITALRPPDLADDEDYLIIKNGCVTDVSSSTAAFFDGTAWYVPDTPLLPGTSRERLIENGIVSERRIHKNDIRNYSYVCVFNAMIDFKKIIINTDSIREV